MLQYFVYGIWYFDRDIQKQICGLFFDTVLFLLKLANICRERQTLRSEDNEAIDERTF